MVFLCSLVLRITRNLMHSHSWQLKLSAGASIPAYLGLSMWPLAQAGLGFFEARWLGPESKPVEKERDRESTGSKW